MLVNRASIQKGYERTGGSDGGRGAAAADGDSKSWMEKEKANLSC
jgi:hypothetical protein